MNPQTTPASAPAQAATPGAAPISDSAPTAAAREANHASIPPLSDAPTDPSDTPREVSFVANIRKRDDRPIHLSIEEALGDVRSGKYARQIERIRQEADPNRRRADKQNLPAFAFAGAFERVNSEPESLLKPSGVVVLDLDKMDDGELAAQRERLTSSPLTRAVFRSPSGNGLKVLVSVTPAPRTNEESKAAYHHVADVLGVDADPAACDISRLCFVSHDPDLYSNPQAKALDVSQAALPGKLHPPKLNAPRTPPTRVDRGPVARRHMREPGAEITSLRDGEKHSMLLHTGGILRHEGYSDYIIRTTLHHLHETHSDNPGDPAGVDKIADYLAKCAVGEGESRPSFLKRIAAVAPVQPGREMLTIKTANVWVREAQERPLPRKLLGSLIFEREVIFCFADTNVGKSVLAVQIADHISRGVQLGPFELEVEAQKVLYLDCELSDQQFAARTLGPGGHPYAFDDRFLRAEINPLADVKGRFDEAVLQEMERAITDTGARVVIVDNLSYLKSETQEAKDAVPLMKELVRLKRQYGLTLIVVAHTPKRDGSRPILANDLAGSRTLLNFADAAFSIGRSSEGEDLRYIKQVKVRSSQQEYGERNVALCRLEKQQGLLGFTFVRFDDEQVHLRDRKVAEAHPLVDEMRQLKAEGLSLRAIGEKLGVNHMRVKRELEKQDPSSSEGTINIMDFL